MKNSLRCATVTSTSRAICNARKNSSLNAGWNQRDEAYLFSRFNPASPVSRLVDGAPYNRAFRLAQAQPEGHALLIHGLTDSPYSAKALADSLHARGFDVTVLRRPDRVLLVSPAIELTRVAALASIIDFLSIVPIPLLEKVRWQNVNSEFDPYKFNSFPVNASRQVNRSTRALQASLLRTRETGRIKQLPPVRHLAIDGRFNGGLARRRRTPPRTPCGGRG